MKTLDFELIFPEVDLSAVDGAETRYALSCEELDNGKVEGKLKHAVLAEV